MAAIKMVHPQIVVGGHDITEHVRSYRVYQDVRDAVPTMVVELTLPDAAMIVEHPAVAEHARVELDDRTRAALIALGWMPPDPR